MKTTLYEAYRKKYPNYADKTKERFVTSTGCDFTWDNMTKSNLYDYVSYLKTVMAKSSARTMCAMLSCAPTKMRLRYPKIGKIPSTSKRRLLSKYSSPTTKSKWFLTTTQQPKKSAS